MVLETSRNHHLHWWDHIALTVIEARNAFLGGRRRGGEERKMWFLVSLIWQHVSSKCVLNLDDSDRRELIVKSNKSPWKIWNIFISILKSIYFQVISIDIDCASIYTNVWRCDLWQYITDVMKGSNEYFRWMMQFNCCKLCARLKYFVSFTSKKYSKV